MRGVTRSLDPLLSPRSIAVIGASRDPGSIGLGAAAQPGRGEFTGPVYPVNPARRVVHSLTCYPSVGAIPDPVDLAVIVVPRGAGAGVVDECLAKGVRGLVVITAGFAETGEDGRGGRGASCATGARRRHAHDRPQLHGRHQHRPATCAQRHLRAGARRAPAAVGFVSQSGALGVAILNVARASSASGSPSSSRWATRPTSPATICSSTGRTTRRPASSACTSSRSATRAASPRSPSASAARKPILIVKSRAHGGGRARGASSHTGALAGADVTVSAFLEQCGVLRADTIEELFDVARALDRCPLPAGAGWHRHQRRRAGDHGHRRLRRPGARDGGARRRDARRARRRSCPPRRASPTRST